MLDHPGHVEDDRIDDLSLGHHDGHAARHPHDHGAQQNLAEALLEGVADGVGVQPSKDAGDQADGEEHPAHVEHLPLPGQDAPDHPGEHQDSGDPRQDLPRRRLGMGCPILLGELLPPALVDLADEALRGVPAHPGRVANDVEHREKGQDDEHDEAVARPGIERHVGDLLRQPDRERVGDRPREPRRRGTEGRGGGSDGVESQRQHQGQDDGYVDQRELLSSDKGRYGCKDHHQDGDDQDAPPGHSARQSRDPDGYRARALDDPEGAAHAEGHGNDGRGLRKTLRDGHEDAQHAHRGPLDPMIGRGVHHHSCGTLHFDGNAVVHAGGDDAGAEGHQGDEEEEDGEDVRLGETQLPVMGCLFHIRIAHARIAHARISPYRFRLQDRGRGTRSGMGVSQGRRGSPSGRLVSVQTNPRRSYRRSAPCG